MIRKTAVVFGASGDIGKEIAVEFAKNGYNLGLTYCNTGVDEFASNLEKQFGVKILAKRVDVLSSLEIQNSLDVFLKEFGTIDAGVLAFGIADKQSLLIDKNDEEIKRVVEVNLLGSLFVDRELCKVMLKQKRGAIVNISSVIGVHGASCETAYAASKAGIIGLTKSLAKEFGLFGIRINSVSPGFIDTKMCACFDEEDKNSVRENTILARLGNVQDVSKVVMFLCDDGAKFITGENLEVSGGLKL